MSDGLEHAFIKTISERIEKLNKTREGICWLCGFPIKNWGVLLPQDTSDDLGFGSKDENTARIVFFPVCSIHDICEKENKEKIIRTLILKKMEFSN